MAKAKAKDKSIVIKGHYVFYHKLKCAVAMISLFLMLISGTMNGVALDTIAYRACWVIFIIAVICRVLVTILSKYEEINSGKA